jgi:hypothetical protein
METYGGKFEDTPKVKWQKAQGRTAQIRAMIGSTKDIYEDQYGEIPKIEVLTDPRGRPAGAAAPAAGGKATYKYDKNGNRIPG